MEVLVVVSVQNLYYIDEMCEWISKQKFDFVYFNVLHDAWHFSISRLPQTAKNLCNDKLSSYNGPYANEVRNLLQFMNNGENTDGSKLIQVLKQSDVQRNQKFSDHHYEMAAAIGYE